MPRSLPDWAAFRRRSCTSSSVCLAKPTTMYETLRLQQFESNLRKQGLDANFYLGEMDPNGIMPWAQVSTGVPEWYLRQEFGRSRGLGGQVVPVLDLPPKAAALVEAARLAGSA